MGMDVYGIGNEKAYFRANVWSWRPIVELMKLAGYNVPNSWHYNDGAGLKTSEECQFLADLLEDYLENNQFTKHETDIDGMRILTGTGRFAPDDYEGATESAYYVQREHFKEFIKFLRECDGFEIW